jgi:hypothetical protein
MDDKKSTLRFLDPRHGRIAERLLLLVGPGAAAFFRDACRHMADPSGMESTTHLVGHLLRELNSSLRDVLHPLTGKEMVVDAAGHLKADGSEKATVLAILSALGIRPDENIAKAWLRHAGSLQRWAHRRSLDAPRPVDGEFQEFWSNAVDYLDGVLDRFEKSFLGVQRRIDRLVDKAVPDPIDVKYLKETVPNSPAGRGYFFDRLQSDGWVRPLQDAGLLSEPPAAIRNEQEGTVSFPPWPAGRFLARMAKVPAVQPLVGEIAVRLPAGDNAVVAEVLADIALALPPSLSKGLVPSLRSWLGNPHHGWLEDKLADFVAAIASAGESVEPLELARDLFAVFPDPKRSEEGEGDFALPPHPTGRVDAWHYGRMLKRSAEPLARAAGMEALRLFCALLDQAVELSVRKRERSQEQDYSWIWREATDQHTQRHAGGVRDCLIDAVRDIATSIVETETESLQVVVEMLEAQRWLVFKRLAFCLLATAARPDIAMAERRLSDRAHFDNYGLRHEYSLLAKRCYSQLAQPSRATILSWIEEGPNLERFKSDVQENMGRPANEDEIGKYREIWQRDRLSLLGDGLDPVWAKRLAALSTKHGAPEHPDLPSHMKSWVGPTSPKSIDDLRAMPVGELVSFLSSWMPPSDWMSPSREGLGRQLAELVAADPGWFVDATELFKGLDPTYVSSLFSGLNSALRAGRVFEWMPVLQLADWAVRQSDLGLPKRDLDDGDQNWGWTRKVIADLLELGLGSRPTALELQHREFLWPLVSILVGDVDPTPEHEAQYGGTNMDPATMSLNTVRGQAMYAAVEYARWLAYIGVAKGARAFDSMPEVRQLLDAHLDTALDPSTTVRAVYGRQLPMLHYLDPGWVEERIGRIFPSDEDQRTLRDAAWETFLAFNSPHQTWPILADEYRRAVEDIEGQSAKAPGRRDPNETLAEHLMVLYWHGSEGCDPLVDRFFEIAPDELRQHAISFLGRSLKGIEGDVPAEVVARLKGLWQRRVEAARRKQSEHRLELAAFAWWAGAPPLELEWRLDQVFTVLRMTGHLDPEFVVTEMLAEAASSLPKRAVDCLALLVTPEADPWGAVAQSQEARTVVETALSCGEVEAATAAAELVSSLAARGHRELVDLLTKKPQPA